MCLIPHFSEHYRHPLVSAFADRRVEKFDVRIIGMFRRDSVQPLRCVFCCSDRTPAGQTSSEVSGETPAKVLKHSDHFGFPYGATDVLCRIPGGCLATHVTLVPEDQRPDAAALNRTFLPIRNRGGRGQGGGPPAPAQPHRLHLQPLRRVQQRPAVHAGSGDVQVSAQLIYLTIYISIYLYIYISIYLYIYSIYL